MENQQEIVNSQEIDELIHLDISTKHISEFFKVLGKSISKHTPSKILSILKNLDVQTEFNNNKQDELVNYICECVANDYNVKVENLFNKKKRGDVTLARKMCIVVMKEFITDIGDTALADFFGRSRQVIFNSLDEHKKLDKDNRIDIHQLNRHTRICREIELYVQKSNLKK